MRPRPYLYSLFGVAIGFSFFTPQIQPVPPTIQLDPRLSPELAQTITGISFPKRDSLMLAGFAIDIKLPIQPPSLYLGFDQPSTDMKSSPVKKNQYRIVTAFHSLRAPLKSLDDLGSTFRSATIYTDDKMVQARFQSELPHLKFIEDTQAILKEISANENALAIINVEKITPKVRALSDSFAVSVWFGWKKSSFPLADQIGINNELNNTTQQVLKNVHLQKNPPTSTLVSVGDIMLARTIGKRLSNEIKQKGETSYPFGGTLDVLRNADIAIGNLECTISNRGKPMPGKDYTFRAGLNAIQQLTSAGFAIVTLANNHSKDYGADALIDTLDHLKKAGITTVGAGRNRSEAREFKVLTTKDGTRVGFLGYTMVLPKDFLANSKSAGVAWTKEGGLAKDMKAARAACDILMVQYHWGKEYTVKPNEAQRTLAHKTIDLGADIVIGHHPHWIQEVEFYKDKFIAYSLGNFVFDMNHRPKVTEGMIVSCEIRNKKITQIHCDPVSLKSGEPEIISWNAVAKRDRTTIMKEIYAASGIIKADQPVVQKNPPIKLAKAR